jgi:hypothetical protein
MSEGCKAMIMVGPFAMTQCGEPCIIHVDKTVESKRYKNPTGESDTFMFPHVRGQYCYYHQKLHDRQLDPYFPISKEGV